MLEAFDRAGITAACKAGLDLGWVYVRAGARTLQTDPLPATCLGPLAEPHGLSVASCFRVYPLREQGSRWWYPET
jgi:hypothetical protein